MRILNWAGKVVRLLIACVLWQLGELFFWISRKLKPIEYTEEDDCENPHLYSE